MKKNILELFGGIGAPRKAFNNLNIEVDSDYVEFNQNVVTAYNLIFKENENVKDVKEFKAENKKYDYLFAGFPCQPFSIAGKRLGFEDPRGKLYKDTLKIIDETLPDNVILENVKGILREENKWIVDEIVEHLKNLNYSVIFKVINSYDFGYLQKRARVFILGSKIKKLDINEFEKYLENNKKKANKIKYNITNFSNYESYNINELKEYSNYWIIPRKSDGKLEGGAYNRVWKLDKSVGTVTTTINLKIGIVNNGRLYYRLVTPKEAMLFQDFNLSDYNSLKDKLSDIKIFHVAGNSMVVGVIELIIKYLN